MSCNFIDCRTVLLTSLTEALQMSKDAILAIERDGRGMLPINGVSYDVTPWHGMAGVSFRLSSDPRDGESRYNSADWKLFNFVPTETCPPLQAAGQYIHQAYRSGEEGKDLAHLIFLAGADALLDAA